jgi:hypothetical protein
MMANSIVTHRDRRKVAGVVLAVIGVALFWLNVTEGTSEAVIMAALGALFVAGYFMGRGYGLLIPGCILLGLGLGDLADAAWFGDFKQLGLGLGFLAIYFIDRARSGYTAWWPLIPGSLLTLSGLGAEFRSVRIAVEKGWPLILVVIGVALVMGWGTRRRDNGDRPAEPRGPHESHGPHAD